MPQLQNHRYEIFARVRANGARLEEAYQAAGFVAGHKHASRLARNPEVAQRIGELREGAQPPDLAQPAALIASLLELAQTSLARGESGTKEARMAFMDAFRVRAAWKKERWDDFKAVMDWADHDAEDNKPITSAA